MKPVNTAVKQNESETQEEYEQGLADEEARMQIEQMVQVFGAGLQRKFDIQVGLKEELEQRWLNDLRHFNGRYDRDTEMKMAEAANSDGPKKNASRIFVNLTRAKTNVAESKWVDLVLPTDDRNWGIKPTPVPEVSKALTDDEPMDALADGSVAVDPETQEPYKKSDMAESIMEEAKEAAELMQTEIDDQLVEAKYNAVCREVIHDAVTIGTGIMKGPMVERAAKKKWVQEGEDWALSAEQDTRPTANRVDPWNFFPDMSATRWEDCEFVFERHLVTRKQLRKLASQPGYMADQIRDVLFQSPTARSSKLNYLNELREINGITQIQNDNRYELLEYHGPIDKENLIACGCKGVSQDDPLQEIDGTVWLCAGVVIKVALNHMDSEELPYSVLNWEQDETSIFGFGVPYRMSSPQRVMNASWRMVLDNAGLSTGPQIVINRKLVSPADGKWELTPRKIWFLNTDDPKFRVDYAMQTFNIDNNQQALTNIFEMAHRLADEETSVPQMQMGAQPGDTQQPAMLKTLGGTAMWMSANNIMMRRAVKNFDDNITVPFIGRFYDWNMQFNKKTEIKGDYTIDARGTSVLLVREMQARNLETFINAALSMPGGPEELKVRGVLKNMAKGMQVAVDDVMRTDEEKGQEDKQAAEMPQQQDPEMLKVQAQKEIKQMEIDGRMRERELEAQQKQMDMEAQRQIALINREVELTKLAADKDINLEKIRSESGIKKYDLDWSIKRFYEEAAIKEREGETANYGLE